MRFHNPGTCFHRIVGLTVQWPGQCRPSVSQYVDIYQYLRKESVSRRLPRWRESDWKSNCTPWIVQASLIGTATAVA